VGLLEVYNYGQLVITSWYYSLAKTGDIDEIRSFLMYKISLDIESCDNRVLSDKLAI